MMLMFLCDKSAGCDSGGMNDVSIFIIVYYNLIICFICFPQV